ncbi:MAG: four helix bundle protein [bacterium]
MKIRLYLRLCERWQWLTSGQYRHASEQVAEIGRLLGGWLKTVFGCVRPTSFRYARNVARGFCAAEAIKMARSLPWPGTKYIFILVPGKY